MITSNGKLQIKRFLAGQASSIASYIALGTGATAATVNDTRLGFEVVRTPILSISVDPNSDKVVFRTSLNPGVINTAYEIGLWGSAPTDEGRALSVVGSNLPVVWTNGTLTNTNARANAMALKVDYVANGTTNAELTGFYEDLSRFRDIDSLVVAYYATTNLSSVRVRLGLDATNYFEYVLPAPVANSYNIARLVRSAATKTGTPDWSAIRYMALRPSATAAGAGSVFLDGVRIESNALDNGNLLVARTVLATPTVMDADISSDIEYALNVSVA